MKIWGMASYDHLMLLSKFCEKNNIDLTFLHLPILKNHACPFWKTYWNYMKIRGMASYDHPMLLRKFFEKINIYMSDFPHIF